MALTDDPSTSTGIVGGRPWPRPTPNWRPPSSWYVFHLNIMVLGMVFLTTGLGGEIRIRMGLAGSDALNHEGLWMLIFCGLMGYWFRLIFWGRVPQRYKNMVRAALSAFLATGLPLAAVTMFLAAAQGDIQLPDDPVYHRLAPVLVTVFTIIGALCQISTVIWLLRYRKE